MGWGRFIAAVLGLAWALAAAAQDSYPFRIEWVKAGDRAMLVAVNEGAATVSAVLRLTEATNVVTSVPLPAGVVARPRSRADVAQLARADAAAPWSFQYAYEWRFGDYTGGHDTQALYRLPYLDGRAFRMIQAPDGPFTTHLDAESRDAIDFAMPEGTPVLATRDGLVINVVSHHTLGRPDRALRDKGNFVHVQHADATAAIYLHLMPGGAAVRTGDTVKAGDIVGYSGNTGFSFGPHLHFAVLRVELADGKLRDVSVPIRFAPGKNAPGFAARTGMEIVAGASEKGELVKARLDQPVPQPLIVRDFVPQPPQPWYVVLLQEWRWEIAIGAALLILLARGAVRRY